jgi:hypothetical protein
MWSNPHEQDTCPLGMVMGGIPMYLRDAEPGQSADQTIDASFVSTKTGICGMLRIENVLIKLQIDGI